MSIQYLEADDVSVIFDDPCTLRIDSMDLDAIIDPLAEDPSPADLRLGRVYLNPMGSAHRSPLWDQEAILSQILASDCTDAKVWLHACCW